MLGTRHAQGAGASDMRGDAGGGGRGDVEKAVGGGFGGEAMLEGAVAVVCGAIVEAGWLV